MKNDFIAFVEQYYATRW